MNRTEMWTALEAAFETRGMSDAKRSALTRTLHLLVGIGQTPGLSVERQKVVLRSLRRLGAKEARCELDRLANAADKFVEAIEALHAPSTAALARAGVFNVNDEPSLEAYRALAGKASTAKALVESDNGLKRPRDLRPQMVAYIIANAYEEIWGGNVNLPGPDAGPGAID